MKDTPHDYFASDDLIKQDVPVKGTQDDEKSPRREPRMRERQGGADDRMALEQCAGARNRRKVPLGHIPTRALGIPLVLQFGVGNEVVRLADAHAAVYNAFDMQRHLISRSTHRLFRAAAQSAWTNATAATI